MKKTRIFGAVCACIVGIFMNYSVWASPVTISSNNVQSIAVDVSTTSDAFTGTAIPSTDTLTATTSSSNSSSITNINYSGDASNTTFAYDFSHSIDNTDGDTTSSDYAHTYGGSLWFTADTNATYSIDGFYEMTGPSGTNVILSVWLQEIGVGYLFNDYSVSYSTANQSFVVGVVGDGDNFNTNEGTLTGNLLAGHDYRFYFEALIRATDGNSTTQVAATADGEVNLIISAVPIPPAVLLFGSGLLGLVGISRRKKVA